MDEKQAQLTEAQKHVVVLQNLMQVLLNTKFTPGEFLPATEMIKFVDTLKCQADEAAQTSPPIAS